jgi:hypothetical protein
MLSITVQGLEMWDEANEKFLDEPSFQLDLEHSLISLSKWESKFEKAFLGDSEKTQDEMLWYIHFMVITPGVSLEKLSRLSAENLKEINEYIDSKQTATTFREETKKKGRPEKITAELIYYWMYSFNIPHQWETRHLNQLLALIRVFGAKQSKSGGSGKKMSRQELAEHNRRINEERRAKYGTSG